MMLCTCFFKCTLNQELSLSLLLSFKTEIKRMSVFKNYEPGEPTCRLYVKNVAKQVEEKVGAFIALDPPVCLFSFLDMFVFCLFLKTPLSVIEILCY